MSVSMKNRLLSLDVLRGMTMILMTIVNNPGDWEHVYPPFLHAEWHGCTLTDLVFPTFLFIVGVTTVLSSPDRGLDQEKFKRLLTRFLRILCLGLFLSFFSKIHFLNWEGVSLLYVRLFFSLIAGYALLGDYDKKLQLSVAIAVFAVMMTLAFGGFPDFQNVRIPGVLQRIAVVYLAISILYHVTSLKTQLCIGASLLVMYWILMTFVPVPGFGPANLEKGTNLAAWVDQLVLPNHLWITSKTWDPEGILSTIPAIVTGLTGLWAGSILNSAKSPMEKAGTLFLISASLIISGWISDIFFPLNKALWTSSYVLFAGGWSMLALSVLYYIIDIRGRKKFIQPFVAFGVNPMILFFLSGIIPRAWNVFKLSDPNPPYDLIGLKEYWYKYCLSPVFENPYNSSLADALIYLLFWYIAVSILLQRRIFIKV